MTTEPKPYTVPMLREWAKDFRDWADHGYHKNGSQERYRAQAAAFDALADGMEVSLATSKSRRKLRSEVGSFMHRILQGEKP
jgi:hypothetical protein